VFASSLRMNATCSARLISPLAAGWRELRAPLLPAASESPATPPPTACNWPCACQRGSTGLEISWAGRSAADAWRIDFPFPARARQHPGPGSCSTVWLAGPGGH